MESSAGKAYKIIEQFFTEVLGLNSAHADTFRRVATYRSLKRKEFLIREGTVCDFIGIVINGSLRSFVANAEAEFNNDFYFGSSIVSAYSSYLTEEKTNCNIQALEDAELVMITRRDLDVLIEADLSWLKFTQHVSDTYFKRKCRRETSFLKYTAKERYECVLTTYPGIEQLVPQYHIASFLGIKPESLSRIKLLAYINGG
ncbi:cAMP-binding domain of CRP or a regulatory subunit of cAMP-dependent protein kinases [Pedobacter westerhofensis]|uniref:cAMP-binding domain of CRP or a regulatory subunit of cAMP-dependent protein kinases n=1 Tax=Pedobacter westerhofensis TaxID=425512 RepID=A0A521FL58_9SPHI|nr:Crp/Fnr family transcriptional regulator [Pedobacter westerhofensis]SMO96794.1 cAMP-binding domain of CRP or a regulatory subunit of cAMP-dependent protein kinases [Pedobacter westerhofensis]